MFDPPFYDIIFLDPPFLVNYFYSIPPFSQLFLLDSPVSNSPLFPPAPPFPQPPRELKNDNSITIGLTIFLKIVSLEYQSFQYICGIICGGHMTTYVGDYFLLNGFETASSFCCWVVGLKDWNPNGHYQCSSDDKQ